MTKYSPHSSYIWKTIQNTTVIAFEPFIEHLLFHRLYTLHRISFLGVWLDLNRKRKEEKLCGEWLETVGRAGFVRVRPSVKGKKS